MKRLEKLTDWLASIPLLLLLVLFNVAVVMRYWFHQPLQWTEEVSGLLMVWIVMLGSVSAQRDDQHLTIPLIVELLPKKVRDVLNSTIAVLSGMFLLYVSYAGYQLAVGAQYKMTSILKVSYYWIDIAVPVGFILIAFYMFIGAYKTLRDIFTGGKV